MFVFMWNLIKNKWPWFKIIAHWQGKKTRISCIWRENSIKNGKYFITIWIDLYRNCIFLNVAQFACLEYRLSNAHLKQLYQFFINENSFEKSNSAIWWLDLYSCYPKFIVKYRFHIFFLFTLRIFCIINVMSSIRQWSRWGDCKMYVWKICISSFYERKVWIFLTKDKKKESMWKNDISIRKTFKNPN